MSALSHEAWRLCRWHGREEPRVEPPDDELDALYEGLESVRVHVVSRAAERWRDGRLRVYVDFDLGGSVHRLQPEPEDRNGERDVPPELAFLLRKRFDPYPVDGLAESVGQRAESAKVLPTEHEQFVLVHVGEVAEYREHGWVVGRVEFWRVGLVQRELISGIVADVAQRFRLGEPLRPIKDREEDLTRLLFGRLPFEVEEGELPGDVIKGKSEAVKRLSDDEPALVGRELSDADAHRVASQVRVVIHENAVALGLQGGIEKLVKPRYLFASTLGTLPRVAEVQNHPRHALPSP